MTDQELRDLVASLAVAQQETDRQQQETARQQKETALQQQETDRQLKETDRQLKETDLQLRKQLKELGAQIGGLGNKFGRFTEGQAYPAMEKILREQFQMEIISQRVKSPVIGYEQEIDVLAYNNGSRNDVFVVEVKSLLRDRELQQVLTVMQRFPQAFPLHADKHLYGIVAVVDASPEMQRRVLEEGLYLAVINDEQFHLAVPGDFHPKQFNPGLAA